MAFCMEKYFFFFTIRHVKGRESECIEFCKPKRNVWIPLEIRATYCIQLSYGGRYLQAIGLWAERSDTPCI